MLIRHTSDSVYVPGRCFSLAGLHSVQQERPDAVGCACLLGSTSISNGVVQDDSTAAARVVSNKVLRSKEEVRSKQVLVV